MNVLLQVDIKDVEVLRRLLKGADATTMRRDGSAAPDRLLGKLEAAAEYHQGLYDERMARARELVEDMRPYFEQARSEGKFVRQTYTLPQGRGADVGYIALPLRRERLDWVAALTVLTEEQGERMQMVYSEHEHGATVEGYRFAPPGDERDSIELSVLYAQAGRCRHCGRTPEGSKTALGFCKHEFASDESSQAA